MSWVMSMVFPVRRVSWSAQPRVGFQIQGTTMTFSDEVQGVMNRAFVFATENGHEEITPEHVVLELMVEDETATYLARCGTDLVAVESRLRAHLSDIEA